MSESFAPAIAVSLRAGESRVIRAAAGSRWVALRGSVRLADAPRWLGERVVHVEQRLDAGAEHRVEHAGWLTVQASTDAHLLAWAPSRPTAALAAALWRIIRFTRRALAPV